MFGGGERERPGGFADARLCMIPASAAAGPDDDAVLESRPDGSSTSVTVGLRRGDGTDIGEFLPASLSIISSISSI